MQDRIDYYIRRIGAADTDRLSNYFTSLSPNTRYFFTPHDLDRAFAEQLTHADRENPDKRRFVMVTRQETEQIVGYFYFWDWQKKVPWFGIGVRDGYQGKGLGNRIMQHAIQEARQHNKGGILLTTRQDNTRAQGLYRKFGFEILGVEPKGEYLLLLNFTDEPS